MTADVSGGRRAENRVGDGVAHRVCVRMPVESFVERDRDATQDQRTPCHEAMQIIAVADPDCGGAVLPSEEPLRHVEILRRRDLQVARIALDEMHVVSGLLGEHRLVGRIGRR